MNVVREDFVKCVNAGACYVDVVDLTPDIGDVRRIIRAVARDANAQAAIHVVRNFGHLQHRIFFVIGTNDDFARDADELEIRAFDPAPLSWAPRPVRPPDRRATEANAGPDFASLIARNERYADVVGTTPTPRLQ